VIKNKSNKTLFQSEDTRKVFSKKFKAIIDSYGYGNRLKPEKRKTTLGKEIGVGGIQITRYADGDQMPSLETFVKICIKFQLEPSEALGLIWKNSKDDKDGVVTRWQVKDDLKMGGLRLYWVCDTCSKRNIEYLDRDGAMLDAIEDTESDVAMGVKRNKMYADTLYTVELMCEHCGLCFKGLKDFAEWKATNT